MLLVVGPLGAITTCGSVGPIVGAPYATGDAASCVPASSAHSAAAPAPAHVPRTKVVEVAAPADTTCRGATDARAMVGCLGAAVRAEDARLAEAEREAREPLARTRPAATVAAFDRAAATWRRFRDEECRARALAIGGGSAAAYEGLACQRRLACERRAALASASDVTSPAWR